MKKIKYDRQKINLIVAIIALALILLANILNYFRLELFGVIHGYAPHNFAFNLTIFFPLNFFGILLSIITLTLTLGKWRKWTNIRMKWTTLIFNFIVILYVLFILFRIVMIMRNH